MKNGGENDQSASFVYKGQYFWYLQTKRHCFTQTNSEINGDFKGKECICSVQLAGIFTTHFTYSLFLSAATELMHTGPWRALETYMPQIWKECGGAAAHKATASSCRAISDQACYFYILNDKFKKRSKMAKYQKCQDFIPFLTPWQSSLSHNTQLLDATVWTPTFWCFPFCTCISIPVSVLLRDKKWGRKINLASFQLPYDTNWFVSPAAPCCWPDLFAHEQLLTSACWSLCCNLPDYLESSYSKLNLA